MQKHQENSQLNNNNETKLSTFAIIQLKTLLCICQQARIQCQLIFMIVNIHKSEKTHQKSI